MKVQGTSWNLTTDTIFINRYHNITSIVTTKREALQSISLVSAEFTTHWVSFLQPGCKAVYSGTAEQRKRLGQVTESITSKSMEHMWEPDSIILSAITQIYWKRQTQTIVLYRYLCRHLFSSSIPLLASKWKSNCQPDIFQGTCCPSKTSQYSKVRTAKCSYQNKMPQL